MRIFNGLSRGSRGAAVKALQMELIRSRGAQLVPDGVYGSRTYAAVAEYQMHYYVDDRHGEAGAETLRVMGLWSDVDYGIDVSHHQGPIDWERVASAKLWRWACAKVSQGASFIDPRGAENLRGASAAGLEVGAYHFADGVRPPSDEAEHFQAQLASIGVVPSWVALDVEGPFARGGQNGREWVLDWLRHFPRALLYTSARIVREKRLGDLSGLAPLWAPRYSTHDTGGAQPGTSPWPNWSIWQYSDRGQVPGIGGDVDLDVRVLR